jgi:hypothetical protein
MNSKIINVLVFAAGAAIGSAVTWKIVKDQYERIVQEEIESIKETFGERPAAEQDSTDDSSDDEEDQGDRSTQINWSDYEDLDEEDEDVEEYCALVKKYNNEEGGVNSVGTKPYVISPYDFGELDDYYQIELTYYADGVLEDDEHNVVQDVDELIGEDSLNTFGEYEDDSVFVRNDRLRTDFQILKDLRTYDEARSVNPGGVHNG